MKKALIFLLVSLFLFGLTAVDESYSSMMGRVGSLSLQTRRIDSDRVRFSMLGMEREANMTEAVQAASEFREKAVFFLDRAVGQAREWLGMEEWPRKDLPFESKVL